MKSHSDIVFERDSLRKSSDIRRLPESKLTWYQKQQRDQIKRRTGQIENDRLRKKIFKTVSSIMEKVG